MNEELVQYIEKNIFPQYSEYYSHGMIHITNVINNCLMLADYYNLNKNMCYAMAAYHDIGLKINRENHEYESGKIFSEDSNMRRFFTEEEITIIKEAIEDHRGSKKEKPRSLYGCVLSDSDRDFDIYLLAKRQLATSLKNYPELKTAEEHFERCYQYILGRINKEGHFNLWTNNEILVRQREQFEKDYLDKEFARKVYLDEYDRISKDGTLTRILKFYKDY